MVNLFLSAVTILLGGLPIETGILSQYEQGVMPPVVAARQEWEQLPDDLTGIDGFIAVWDCDQIGRPGLLSINNGEWKTVLVADCSGHVSTTQWMIANNVIAEISGELAADNDVVCLCAVDGRIVWLD